MIKINLSKKRLKSSFEDISLIFSEFQKLQTKRGKDSFIIDMEKIEELHNFPQLLIWILSEKYKNLGCKKSFKLPKETIVLRQMRDAHFLDRLTGIPTLSKKYDYPINFESFSVLNKSSIEANQVIERITKSLLSGYLDHSESEFDSELSLHVQEIINNAFDHSQSREEVVCLFSINKEGILDFSIYDGGQGFKKSFTSNPSLSQFFSSLSDSESIERATKEGVSCNPKSLPHPKYKKGNAGFGLYFLRKFIETHPIGKIAIISKKGYFSVGNSDKMVLRDSLNPFEGTIISFRIKLQKERSDEFKKYVERYMSDK
jgi:hypothetical protein